MSTPESFDVLVLGSGEGGKYLAWHMARAGHRTAVVERKLIGGSCPNTNCLPSKNEIWSAKVADLVRRADSFGTAAGAAVVDMKKVLARKRNMVEGLITMHLDLYKASGASLILGHGRFIAPKTLEVSLNDGGTRILTGNRVVINVGTHATIPDIPGLTDAQPLTNVEMLELDRLPEHLIVLGGGYVGLELAQAYRRFGSRVTILDSGQQLAAREDADVSAEIHAFLRDEGIAVHLGSRVRRVDGRSGSVVSLRIDTTDGERTIEGSDLLVATGRTPNTAGIGLEAAGVALDARGFITVDEGLHTTAPDTWAIGECAGTPQFTHASFDDFRVVRSAMNGEARTTRNRLIPYCMYTDPPLARVGLSEAEALQRGVAMRVATLPIANVLRASTLSESRGFMKAVVEAGGDRILGFTMIGPDAGEVMAVVQTAMLAGMPYTDLRDAILAHPTMAEGLNSLFSRLPK